MLLNRFLFLLAACMPVAFAQPLSITTPAALTPATANQAYSVSLSATGGLAPYIWHFVSGSTPSPRFSLSGSGTLTGTPTSADVGTQAFLIQVTDSAGTNASQQFSLLVQQATQPLLLTNVAFTPAVVGVPYSLQLTGTGGIAPYTWSVVPAIVTFPVPNQVVSGLLLNPSTGLVTGTPTVAATSTFTITLTDAAHTAVSKTFTITVTPAGLLALTTATLPGGTVGIAYSQALQAAGGVPPYKWAVSTGSLPGGLALDPTFGFLSGVPVAATSASFTVSLTDSAATPAVVKQPLTLQVIALTPLSLTTSTIVGATLGIPYSQGLAATGGMSPYTWSVITGTLPAGLSLGATSGIIAGTPTALGSSSFTIQVADSSAGTQNKASKSYTVAVTVLTPVLVTAGTLAAGMANSPYSQILPATGGAAPYSWSVIAGSLPPGLLLSGSGTLSGVPSTAGTFGFTGRVGDASGGVAVGAFSVVLASAPLSMVPVTLPSAVSTVAYPSQVLSASGGTPPYTFSIQGSLPQGLTLTNGAIAGTPGASGTASFSVMVTDSAQATATTPGRILVRPSLPSDLVLSTGALSFSLASGASDVPGPQFFTIASSNSGSILNYQVSMAPAAPWLTVSGGLTATASTPGGISVALNSQALALAAATTPYTTILSVSCVAPSACAGSAQTVNVSLTVSSPAPQLMLTKSLVSMVTSVNGQTAGQFGIQNAGGGSITVNSVSSPDSWISLGGAPSTVVSGPPAYVAVAANASNLAPGLYRSTVTVATSAGSANLPVALLVSSALTVALNPSGQQFQMSVGGAVGNAAGTLEVFTSGSTALNWSASVLPGAAWLKVKTATGSSTAAAPGVLSYSIDPTASAALAAGAYYGTIRVTSNQAANTPQDFLVVLNVVPAGSAVNPDPEPSGLIFISSATAAPPPQSIALYASSTTPVPYQAAALTASGTQWLTVAPTSGSVSAGAPGSPAISVNPAGLGPGVYRGVVTYQFSPSSMRGLNVTYIIPNYATGSSVRETELPRATASCAPAILVVTATGIPSAFDPQLAWPVPLAFQVTDNCGNNIPNGSVDASFSNNDPALSLMPDPSNPGRYEGTWTPGRAAAQVTVTGTAMAPGFASALVRVSGSVTPNSAPALTPGAILNVFNPVVGTGIAPGTAVAIYGSNLAAAGTNTTASSLPFPSTLSNVSVLIGTIPAPLYYVSPGQINAEVPFELAAGGTYQVIVSANGAFTMPIDFVSAPGGPGIAAFGNGGIIAQHLDGSLISADSPAAPGETIVFYLAGLGSATNQPATGNPAPVPPTGPLESVTLMLNNAVVPTLFVGLTPGTVGLYQIDFTVPPATPNGSQLLSVTQGNAVSNVTTLPVHQ